MVCHNCHMIIHWGETDFNRNEVMDEVANLWDNRATLSYV